MSQYIDANIEESSGSEISDDGGWIGWFCSLKGNELFVEVDDDYIRDSFNLYGLRSRVRYYDLALDQILGSEAPDEERPTPFAGFKTLAKSSVLCTRLKSDSS